MKDRTDIPVYTWFLIGALVFSVFTFLLGIWVCSHAPRDDQQLSGPVPMVNESESFAGEEPESNQMAADQSETLPSDLVEPIVDESEPVRRNVEAESESVSTPTQPEPKHTVATAQQMTETRPVAKKDDERTYYIQLTATPLKKSAEDLKQKFERKGYNVYLLETRERGRTLYKVRIGVFSTRDQAAKVAEKIRREDKIKPWIVQM